MKISEKKITNFEKWLANNGAEIIPPTSEWEVLRFKAADGVGILYKNKKGIFTAGNKIIQEAYEAFVGQKSWTGTSTSKINRKTSSQSKKALLRRDGDLCFYCHCQLNDENITEEHLLSLAHGGNNRLENKVLACKPCNKKAGTKALKYKFELAIKLRKLTGEKK